MTFRAPLASGARAVRGHDNSDRPLAAALALDADHIRTIDHSHQRCAALGLSRIERPDLGLVDRAEFNVIRERNLRLHAQAVPVMELLYDQIVNTHSMVVLTDATGTIVHAVGDDDFLERAARVALKPGAIWSEASKGTNAVGTALMTEAPTLVHADEHFFHANQFLTCSAAPILDPRGNLLGVLDVSGDHRSYHQHTMALVKMSARMIENQWLSDDYRNVMRLHFHSRVEFIGTLMEGIIAVRPDGRIVGANRGALELLGLSGATLRMKSLESLFGTSVGALVDRFRSPLSTPLSLQASTGLRVHVHARFEWPVWSSLAEAVASTTPPQPLPRVEEVALPAPAALPRPEQQPGDPRVRDALAQTRRALELRLPVLLTGETGSGKKWLARRAHDAVSPGAPFRLVSCAGASSETVDAAFEAMGQAAEGTLLFEEIGELAPAAQASLLRQLAAAEVRGRGVCMVCTQKEPLHMAIQAGQFRQDLYYRLEGLVIRLPALREREDLDALVLELLAGGSANANMAPTPALMATLRRQAWAGNVRQLSLTLRAALVRANGASELDVVHLPAELTAGAVPSLAAASSRPLQLVELDAIREAVAAANGNITEASRRLGISRNTIYRRLRWQ